MRKGLIKFLKKKIIVNEGYICYVNSINKAVETIYKEINRQPVDNLQKTYRQPEEHKPPNISYCLWLKEKSKNITDVY